MITRKERIANAKARLVVLNGILDADVNIGKVPMPHGWTKETAIAWQQKRNIEKYLAINGQEARPTANNDRT